MLLRAVASDLPPPQAAFVSNDVALISLTDPGPGWRDLLASFDAAVLSPPYGVIAVAGRNGPHAIAAVRLPRLGGAAVLLPLQGGELAPLFPGDIADDPLGMLDELDEASRAALLDFVLGFCRTAFRLGRDPAFAANCARMAKLIAGNAGSTRPLARLLPDRVVVRGAHVPTGATLYLIGQGRVRHSSGPILPAGAAGPCGLQVIAPPADGELLVASGAPGAAPRFWTVAGGAEALPNVLSLPVQANASGAQDAGPVPAAAEVRRACCAVLAHEAPGTAGAALLREMQALSPAVPCRHDDVALPFGGAIDLAIPDGADGVFLRGWMRDPLDLVERIELRAGCEVIPVDSGALHRVARPDIIERFTDAPHRDENKRPGFVAYIRGSRAGLGAQPTLVFRFRSSAAELTPRLRTWPASVARDIVLSSVQPADMTAALLNGCLSPPAGRLHQQAMARRGTATVTRIGCRRGTPTVSMLIPLYRNLGFLRFQLAAFAADRACRAAELVYVLDSPEQHAEVEHLLRGLHLLHDLPVTLVTMPRNRGYAAANNEAARHATGRQLLLLNSDVVPFAPGWLEALQGGLAQRGVGAAGPKLLFDDGSIQHAGLYFEQDGDGIWSNRHFHKGMPRRWPGATRRRLVPGVTGAALLVTRPLFEQVGGVCEDYIIGDYEDSDLCLRLRAAGAAIAYVPEAELYHFERRSIALHSGYTRTLACQYNQHLHHARWAPAMASLMQPGAAGKQA